MKAVEKVQALTAAANAKTGESDATLTDAVQTLIDGYGGGGESDHWVRPSGWPALTDLEFENDEEVYFTVDTEEITPAYFFIKFSASKKHYTIDLGLVSNGTYQVIESNEINDSSFVELIPTEYGRYVVYRVRLTDGYTDDHILELRNESVSIPIDGTTTRYTLSARTCPVIEIYGKLQNIQTIRLSDYSVCQSIDLDLAGAKPTNLTSGFSLNNSLKNVCLKNFDGSEVTTINSIFYCDTVLTFLNIPHVIDFSNLQNMGNAFFNCGLKKLDISGWITTDTITSQSGMLGNSYFEELDISNLYVGSLTSLQQIIQFAAMKKFVAKNVDVRHITNVQYLIRGNNSTSLQTLDLTGWDLQSCTNLNSWLYDNMLRNVVWPKFYHSFAVNTYSLLDEQNFIDLFNTLPTVQTAETITLHAAYKALCSDATLQIATDKGWTIA